MPTRATVWPAGAPCWVDCQVDDVPVAAAFYADLLGWRIVDGPPELPGYVLVHRDGYKVAGIGPKPVGLPQPSVWSTYFATTDVEASVAAALAAGGHVMTPPQDLADLGRMSFGTDPAGAPYGVWQAGRHFGMQVFNEPGSLCWNELHTVDHPGARAFYSRAFGWTYTQHSPAGEFDYSFAHTPGVTEPVCGLHLDPRLSREDRSHWLVWFGVRGLAERLATVARLGGTVVTGPVRSPYGPSAVVRAPQGEIFGLTQTRPG